MSAQGHSRRFAPWPATSGLPGPRTTDIVFSDRPGMSQCHKRTSRVVSSRHGTNNRNSHLPSIWVGLGTQCCPFGRTEYVCNRGWCPHLGGQLTFSSRIRESVSSYGSRRNQQILRRHHSWL